MKSGTRPSIFDTRDYSLHRTFGSVAQELPLMEYNYDAGLTMWDQDEPQLPYFDHALFNGCTGMAQADIASDQDGVIYNPIKTYDATCLVEGHGEEDGCDIRTSALTTINQGLWKLEDQTPAYKRAQIFNIDKVPGMDWFDSFRIALRLQAGTKTGISTGTLWPSEWETLVKSDGIAPDFNYSGNRNDYPWHDYKISGEKTIDGLPMLCIKSWQGNAYGDNGWLYISRERFNKIFNIYGTIGLTTAKVGATDIRTISPSLYQWMLQWLQKILPFITIYS